MNYLNGPVRLACMNCGTADSHTSCGGLFCFDCADVLSDEGKDAAIDAYLHRLGLIEAAKKAA